MIEDLPEEIQGKLNEEHACYVLITCKKPTGNGNMEVEMMYQGDKDLVAYLLEGAQSLVEEDLVDVM